MGPVNIVGKSACSLDNTVREAKSFSDTYMTVREKKKDMENIAAAIAINKQLLRSAVLKPQFLPRHFMPRKKLIQSSGIE